MLRRGFASKFLHRVGVVELWALHCSVSPSESQTPDLISCTARGWRCTALLVALQPWQVLPSPSLPRAHSLFFLGAHPFCPSSPRLDVLTASGIFFNYPICNRLPLSPSSFEFPFVFFMALFWFAVALVLFSVLFFLVKSKLTYFYGKYGNLLYGRLTLSLFCLRIYT